MKIKKSELKILIKNFLHEADTGPIKGRAEQNMTDDFSLEPEEEEGFEDYVKAVDAYRNPDKPIGNMPHFNFGDSENVTNDTKFTHIPSDKELEQVRIYQQYKEVDPQRKEFGVDDDEQTIVSFKDEDTEESPLGTQYSLEETEPQFRFDDRTLTDPGFTVHSQDDFVLEPEDEEGFVQPEEYTEADTEYDINIEDKGFLSTIRNFLSRK